MIKPKELKGKFRSNVLPKRVSNKNVMDAFRDRQLRTEYALYVKQHNKLFLKPIHDRGLLDIPFGTNKYYTGNKPISFSSYKLHRLSGGTSQDLTDRDIKDYESHVESANVPSGRTI